jgi:hypothetical protein
MIIDGRGQEYSEPYEKLKSIITKEACLLETAIEVLVDSEHSAKRINVLATLAGYETEITQSGDTWTLRVDTSHRRCT